jgi:hypothetical protein
MNIDWLRGWRERLIGSGGFQHMESLLDALLLRIELCCSLVCVDSISDLVVAGLIQAS